MEIAYSIFRWQKGNGFGTARAGVEPVATFRICSHFFRFQYYCSSFASIGNEPEYRKMPAEGFALSFRTRSTTPCLP